MIAYKAKALYTLQEFADLISATPSQLCYWLNCRLIKSVSLGDEDRISHLELERIMKDGFESPKEK